MRAPALLLLFPALTAAAGLPDFWDEDVWSRRDRPFLYYGGEAPAGPAPPAEAPSAGEGPVFADIGELRAEVRRRLELAVMDPSRERVLDWLRINALLQAKAAAFADAWRDALIAEPRWDWTATHPVVNAVSTRLAREREEETAAVLLGMGPDWGLLFFADDTRLSELALPLVERFAATWGLELVKVAVGGRPPGDGFRPDDGVSGKVAGGLTMFPALALVHRSDRAPERARLLATGAVDPAELARRAARLVGAAPDAAPAPAPATELDQTLKVSLP